MLKLAKKKNPKNTFIYGDCTNLPFKEGEFDYITISFGLRNIENRTQAINEIYRVLEKNGKFLHLDFGNHKFSGKIFDYIVKFMVKIKGLNFENYEYLIKSKNEYPVPDELIKEFEKEGFGLIERKDFLFGTVSYQILQK
jgi:demethylmenaquinone methyltransferase/2-methoxy-6-polyprenyl-1,4-benzoquinol methylase